MPSVLFITGEYPPAPGGVGDYTARLRVALEPFGIRSWVLTGPGEGEEALHVPCWDRRLSHAVLAAVQGTGARIVHLQYQAGAFGMHPAVNLLPRTLRHAAVPVVTTFHDLRPPYLFPKAGRLRDALMLRTARWSRAVIVTNPADERVLRARRLRPWQVPIGPNLPPPSRSVGPPDLATVAFFGLPSASKGVTDAIDALGLLPEDERPRLLLVGAEGTPSASNDLVPPGTLERRAHDAGVRLARTGWLPPQAASDALARAGAIVLPFRAGASLRSGSLLAALQAGRPVVTTAPPVPDDVEPLLSLPQLQLVPPGDHRCLAEALRLALHQPGAWQPLPTAFTWETIAERHAALYRILAGEVN